MKVTLRCFFSPVFIIGITSILSACGGGGGESSVAPKEQGDTNNPENLTFNIGGTITGLSGSITLQNSGNDNLTTGENGRFAFSVSLNNGTAYATSILSAPENQSCAISNENGTIDAASVTNIRVNCEDIPENNDASSGSDDTPSSPGDTPSNPDNTPSSPDDTPSIPDNTPSNPDNTPPNPGNAPPNPGDDTPPSPVNTPPNADAGSNFSVFASDEVSLVGNGADNDGTIISYSWLQTAGPNVTLAQPNASISTFTAPAVSQITDLSFRLTVTDDKNASSTATVTITVQAKPTNAPQANAGTAQDVDEKTAVTLLGSGSDSDGTIMSSTWSQTTGPNITLTDRNALSTTFTAPTVTEVTYLTFELMVTDNDELTANDFVTITIQPINIPPIVSAGNEKNVDEQTTVTLASNVNDNDGNITSYSWQQTAGTTVTLTNTDKASSIFTAPTVTQITELTFELTVTDNENASSSASVAVMVQPVNTTPTVSIGDDIRVQEQNKVALTSSANDPDGEITRYQWQQTKGSMVILNDTNNANISFTAPDVAQETLLEFMVTATDNENATATDTINIIVFSSTQKFKVSGNISFDLVPSDRSGLNYSATTPTPVRGAVVEAINVENETVEASSTTDADGNYLLNLSINKNYFIRVKAQLKQTGTPQWDFSVVDNTSGNALYALVGSTFNVGVKNSTRDMHAPSGWNGSSYSETRSAAPFAILDAIYSAYNKVLLAKPSTSFPSLQIKWSVNNITANGDPDRGEIGTSYYDGESIYLLGATDSDTDEYDRHVIIHEWMHYYVRQLSRDDSMGGAHRGDESLDIRIAYSEGLATAFSAMATDQPVYSDSNGINQSSSFTLNIESDTVSNAGWYNTNSISLTLYDVYDNNNEGDDNLALGFTAINDVLITAMRTTPITSIFPFITALRSNNTASATAIDTLFTAYSMNSNSRIDQYGSDENNHPGNPENILPIFTNLIVGDPAVNICSIANFGTYNKLSNRRFIRFNIANAGIYQITASGGPSNSDPDLILHNNNGLISQSNGVGNNETFSSTLSSGDYVLEVYEYTNISEDPLGTTCFDVSINISGS